MSTEQQSFTFPQRVYELPLVNDSLQTAYGLVQKYSLSQLAYDKATSVACALLDASAPITKRLDGPLHSIDGYANKGLDYVEQRWPAVKSDTKVDDLVQKVAKPAEDAVGIAKSYADGLQTRFHGSTEQLQARFAGTIDSLHQLQERLHKAVQKIPRDQQQAHETLESVKKEMESMQTYLSQQTKELPVQFSEAVKPLQVRLSEGYSHVSDEMKKSDVPLMTRAHNVLGYTQAQVTPIVADTLQAIRDLAFKKKEQAQDKAQETAGEAQAKVNGIADAVQH